MPEPEGWGRRLPRSCLLPPQCLLRFADCKEIKGVISTLPWDHPFPLSILSVLAVPSLPAPALCGFCGEL